MSGATSSQNVVFEGSPSEPSDPLEPEGRAILEQLALAMTAAGWSSTSPDNWRDSGWALQCERRGKSVDLVISSYRSDTWLMQLTSASVRTPGLLGLFKPRVHLATNDDIYEVAEIAHGMLAASDWCSNQRWAWDAPSDEAEAAHMPERYQGAS